MGNSLWGLKIQRALDNFTRIHVAAPGKMDGNGIEAGSIPTGFDYKTKP
jgi:hypothetical protein